LNLDAKRIVAQRMVGPAADAMEASQQRGKLVEVLQARYVRFANVFALTGSRADDYVRRQKTRNTASAGSYRTHKSCAEQN